MQKWQYIWVASHYYDLYGRGNDKISIQGKTAYDYIADLGKNGWEMVSCEKDDASVTTFWFKRPIE